jgi:2-C-methyl-D-erythritol 4-phosphate cytidylyltransferase
MGFDKLWTDLGGQPVVAWSLATLAACREVDRLVIVGASERQHDLAALAEQMAPGHLPAHVVAGGNRRRDSVMAGLRVVSDCPWVLVHDAARPFLSEAVVQRGLREAVSTGACVAALPARDTIKRVHAGTVVETLPREQLWTIQTPQVFRRELVLAALAATDDDATDEAALVERAGGTVRVFEGDLAAFKITTPGDLDLARAMLALRADAVGR